MHYLLDTDTCIDLLRGVSVVVRNAATVSPDECAISTVTAYELLTGARKCRDPEGERQKVESLLGAVPTLVFDAAAAERTAAIRAELESFGPGLGPYDTMLAGQGLTAGLTMVTSNQRGFGRVRGLRCLDWRRAGKS